jgi:plastocyanin
MRPIARGIATFATALALAACSGTSGQSTTAPAPASQAATSEAPAGTEAPAPTTAGSAVCADSTGATTVAATVGDFKWGPVSAKVGDVITWTNSDSVAHGVALDDGSCTMSGNIPPGGKASLVFSVAGTYPFHCTVHASMKGTITITS